MKHKRFQGFKHQLEIFRFDGLSDRGRVTLLFWFLAAIAAGILAAGVYTLARKDIASRHALHEVIAQQAAIQANEFILRHKQILQLFARYGITATTYDEKALQTLLDSYPAFVNLALLDQNGSPLVTAVRDIPHQEDQSGSKKTVWFDQADSGQSLPGRQGNEFNDSPGLVIMVPAGEDRLLAARLDINSILDEITPQRFGRSGQIYIVELQHQTVLPSGVSQSVLDEKRFVITQVPVPSTGISILAQMSTLEFYSSTLTYTITACIFLMVLILIHKQVNTRLTRVLSVSKRQINDQARKWKQAEKNLTRLMKLEERYNLTTQAVNDGLWDWNLRDSTIYLSPRWKSILGHQENELSDQVGEWFSRIHHDDYESFQAHLNQHLQGSSGYFEHEHRLRCKNGSYRWVLARGLAIRRPPSNGKTSLPGQAYRMAGSLTDISNRKQIEAQLYHGTFHDPLTSLPNRALFLEQIQRVLVRISHSPQKHFAVLILDCDRFKIINDSLGHPIGDQFLVNLAKRLENSLRASDTIARLGGDEFVILIENTGSIAEVTQVAERIQEIMKQPFQMDQYQLPITASIGIVYGGIEYASPEEVLRDADIALYRAKALGKDRFEFFDSSLRQRVMAQVELESELRQAIENQEFVLYYQPIVSMEDTRVTGFEALIRWNSPARGFVGPDVFIPVAEETGLIIPIGEWILNEACQQIARWQKNFLQDPPLTMNVNISGVQFFNPSFLNHVQNGLELAGVDPSALKLEITESIFLETSGRAADILELLREMDVQIEIDDFGTGYSSLAYLHHFPINTIKIDRSFINRIGTSTSSSDLIKTIVNLAHDLGMQAVAEGVETQQQIDLLRDLNCPYFQGFYFSQPKPSLEIEALLISLQN